MRVCARAWECVVGVRVGVCAARGGGYRGAGGERDSAEIESAHQTGERCGGGPSRFPRHRWLLVEVLENETQTAKFGREDFGRDN